MLQSRLTRLALLYNKLIVTVPSQIVLSRSPIKNLWVRLHVDKEELRRRRAESAF